MKLIDKNKVNTLKAQERKMEVDEGLKLAKKVDALRALEAKEKKSLIDFRDKAVAEVKKEIADLLSQKTVLQEEVSELEVRRMNALKPIKEEKNLLDEKKEALSQIQVRLEQKEFDLKNRETKVLQATNEVSIEKERIEDEKHRIDDLLSQASRKNDEASIALETAKETERETQARAEIKERQFAQTASDLNRKAVDLDNMRLALEQRELDLGKWHRQLQDTYQTLLRTEQRIKNNNG